MLTRKQLLPDPAASTMLSSFTNKAPILLDTNIRIMPMAAETPHQKMALFFVQ
jgi:hypothetical protein